MATNIAAGSGRRTTVWRPLIDHLPETLVLLALCSLVAFNYYELHSIRQSLHELNQVIEPSTRAASDLQLALSQEAASTRAFLLTGNDEYAKQFHQSRAARREALRILSASIAAVPALDETISDAAENLRVADRWLDGLYAGTITKAEYLAEFPTQHRRFESVIASAAALHRQLRDKATLDRRDIEETERLGTYLQLGGIILSVIAAIAVAGLKHREHAARVLSQAAQADAELRQAQLESATARWMRLIRGFSHDVKNPLNAVDGYLFMLQHGIMSPLSPAQMDAIAKCRRGVQTAVALTTDLVALARAETADVHVHRGEMNLCDLVAHVVDEYRAQASAKGLTVTTELPVVPERVTSDPARVSQILGNLISNAVKYTSAGTVAVAVSRRAGADAEYSVVDVADTGPGIAAEDQARVFDEFERLGTAEPTGTGIGLTIAQRLARTLGGRITLESELGKGATFTLWLPAAEPTRSDAGEDAAGAKALSL